MPVAGGVTNGYLYGAITDQVTFMLEELGMQILHNNTGYEALDAATLGKHYPIDFWLYAEFKVEERAGSPPQVAPKCCRAKLSKLSCMLDCSVSFLLRC